MRPAVGSAILSLILWTACSLQSFAAASACGPAPRAPADKRIDRGAQVRVDEYAWLNDKSDPRALEYLKAEDNYALCSLEPIGALVREVGNELRAHLGERHSSTPFADRGYLYETRFERSANQPVIVRRKLGTRSSEEIVLDVPSLAAGHPYYTVDHWDISPNGNWVAFAVDLTGDRRHRILLRSIATGELTDLGISDGGEDLAFAADGKTLFYIRVDPKTLRANQVWRHHLGRNATSDVLIYTETDVRSEVSVRPSKSQDCIFLISKSEISSETQFLRAVDPNERFKRISPRKDGVKYFVDHVDGKFYIRTNLDAPDYRLMTASEDDPDHWRELIPEQPGRYMRDFTVSKSFVAIEQEHDASLSVRVFRQGDRHEVQLPLTPTLATERLGRNRDPDSSILRFTLSSPIQPRLTYDFDIQTGKLTNSDL